MGFAAATPGGRNPFLYNLYGGVTFVTFVGKLGRFSANPFCDARNLPYGAVNFGDTGELHPLVETLETVTGLW